MRRFLSSVIFVLMVTIPMAAAPSGKIVVTAWPYWSDPNGEAVQKAIAAFNEVYPDIEVEVQNYASGSAYDDKVTTMLVGGVAPDVTWIDPSRVPTWGIQNGWLEDLTPYLDASETIDVKGLVAGGEMYPRYDGNVYAIGTHMYAYTIFYNKDHYDEAGLQYPARGWTWEDFLNNARALTDHEKPRYGYEFDTSTNRLRPWVWQGGGDWWNPEDPAEFMWHLPESTQGLQMLADMICVYEVAVQRGTIRYERGTASMRHTLPSLLAGDLPAFRVGIVTPPAGPGGEAATLNLEGWAMFKGSTNKEAAWAWIEWWASPEAQHMIGAEFREVPAYIPAIQESTFLHLEPNLRREAIDVLIALSQIGRGRVDSYLYDAARGPFSSELGKVWRCEQSVQTAVDKSLPASLAIIEDLRKKQ